MKISTLVIDDDPDSRLILRQYITDHCPGLVIVAESANIADAEQAVLQLQPELLLLDISLPDGSAFDLLEKLPGKNFEVIFITAHDNFAIKAFKLAAVDYLLKPVSYSELGAAIAKVEARLSQQYFHNHWQALLHNSNQPAKKLAIATAEGFLFVEVKDIIRLESQSNYSWFYLAGGKKLLSSRTMGYYEELLPPDMFCRIHHSHLVNVEQAARYIKGGAGGTLVMNDGSELPVSQRKKEEVFRHLVHNKK